MKIIVENAQSSPIANGVASLIAVTLRSRGFMVDVQHEDKTWTNDHGQLKEWAADASPHGVWSQRGFSESDLQKSIQERFVVVEIKSP